MSEKMNVHGWKGAAAFALHALQRALAAARSIPLIFLAYPGYGGGLLIRDPYRTGLP